MANNSQLTYETATIDPTIAGYAARDPGFALGLMLGRGFVSAYNERGEKKLRESLLNSDGSLKDGAEGAVAEMANQALKPAVDEAMQAKSAPPVPQIFAANQNPTMQNVSQYNVGANPSWASTTPQQESVMQNMMAPQQAVDGRGNAIKDKAYAILHDPNNKWVQSADRGDIYNKTGNPYAIGNYNDPAKNIQNQNLMRSMEQKYTPTYTVDPNNGAVTQNAATGYTGINPLQAVGNYAMNTNTIQPHNFNNMNLNQLQNFVNGGNVNPVNFSNAEQGENSTLAQPKDTQGTTATQQTDIIPTENNTQTYANDTDMQHSVENNTNTSSVNNTNTKALPTVKSPNGEITPFRTQDWVARVVQNGIAQGRPMHQIQNVIAQTMPLAKAAEENYVRAATNSIANRIFNGDESTGGVPLIPNGANDNVVIPRLLSSLQELDQVNPEYADKIRNMLPGARDVWGQNRGDINKLRDVGYSMKLADNSTANNIKQHQAFGDIDTAQMANRMKLKHDMESAWRKQDMADMANAISASSGGQITPNQAMFGLLTGAFGGKGKSSSSRAPTKADQQQQQAANAYGDVLNDVLASLTGSDSYRGQALENAQKFMSEDNETWKLVPSEQRNVLIRATTLAEGISLAKSGRTKAAAEMFGRLTPEAWEQMGVKDPSAFLSKMGITEAMINAV